MKTEEEIEQLASDYVNHKPKNAKELRDVNLIKMGYINAYTQCQEDMADKKYTEEDIQNVLDGFTNEAPGQYIKTNFIELLNKQGK